MVSSFRCFVNNEHRIRPFPPSQTLAQYRLWRWSSLQSPPLPARICHATPSEPCDTGPFISALKISGAKKRTHNRSQIKVPSNVKPTKAMTFQRNSSLDDELFQHWDLLSFRDDCFCTGFLAAGVYNLCQISDADVGKRWEMNQLIELRLKFPPQARSSSADECSGWCHEHVEYNWICGSSNEIGFHSKDLNKSQNNIWVDSRSGCHASSDCEHRKEQGLSSHKAFPRWISRAHRISDNEHSTQAVILGDIWGMSSWSSGAGTRFSMTPFIHGWPCHQQDIIMQWLCL